MVKLVISNIFNLFHRHSFMYLPPPIAVGLSLQQFLFKWWLFSLSDSSNHWFFRHYTSLHPKNPQLWIARPCTTHNPPCWRCSQILGHSTLFPEYISTLLTSEVFLFWSLLMLVFTQMIHGTLPFSLQNVLFSTPTSGICSYGHSIDLSLIIARSP